MNEEDSKFTISQLKSNKMDLEHEILQLPHSKQTTEKDKACPIQQPAEHDLISLDQLKILSNELNQLKSLAQQSKIDLENLSNSNVLFKKTLNEGFSSKIASIKQEINKLIK